VRDLVGGIRIGVSERILKSINEYLDVGVTHFIFQFIGLGEKVLRLFYSNGFGPYRSTRTFISKFRYQMVLVTNIAYKVFF
jgi:hypothetical protein